MPRVSTIIEKIKPQYYSMIGFRFSLILFIAGMGNLFSLNYPLIDALKSMYENDQKIRSELIDSGNLLFDEKASVMEKIDYENLTRLKKIIDQFGWPGFHLVGTEGANMAWLLVQHCDQDVEFQKRCLKLIEGAVSREDALKRHVAFLMDRILVNEGQRQIYGTQICVVDGYARAYPVSDPSKLDSRRAEMGLGPFAEYLATLKEMYHLAK